MKILLVVLVLFYFMKEANCQANLMVQFPPGTDCDEVKRVYREFLKVPFVDTNECFDPDACPENSECQNVDCSFNCNCTAGFTESRNTSYFDRLIECIDINECNTTETGQQDPCLNETYTVCINTPGNHTCQCIAGYEKNAMGSCVDIDECDVSNILHNCTENTKCNNIKGGFTCVCADGFSTITMTSTDDPLTCKNIDECATFNTIKNAINVILNTSGNSSDVDVDAARWMVQEYNSNTSNTSSAVVSDANFRGLNPGVTAVYVLEAVGKLQCDFIATCSDTEGSFNCSCPDGFTTNMTSPNECSDVNECTDFETAVGAINAIFFETDGDLVKAFSFLASYMLPSYATPANATILRSKLITNVLNIEAIDNLICDFYATCTNTLGYVTCACRDGFIADGGICVDFNECTAFDVAKDAIADLLNASSETRMNSSMILESYNPGYIANDPAPNTAFKLRYMSTSIYSTISPIIDQLACDFFSTCRNAFGTFNCTCEEPAYVFNTSRSCKDFDECTEPAKYPCRNNSMCDNIEGGFTCPCNAGYNASSPEDSCDDIDECAEGATNRCHQNASCTNTVGNHNCSCDAGFTGTGDTCADIDECAEGASNRCHQNASCNNTEGNHTCSCDAGFSGDGETCADIDECADGATNRCHPNASCTNTEGNHTCSCDAGFTGTGETCEDINECAEEFPNRCHQNASCNNTEGNHTCSCNAGFSGTGETCTDINECNINTTCDDLAECYNNIGSFNCTCSMGYTGMGTPGECSNVDECETEGHDCHANATCADTEGGFNCSCKAGFYGNGKMCTDINECAPMAVNRCHGNASCINTVGNHTCSCNDGFSGNGEQCEDVNECNDNSTCDLLANCTNSDGSFYCTCKNGYSGSGLPGDCSDIHECDLGDKFHDCHENATCCNSNGSFTCKCNPGYFGSGTVCADGRTCDSLFLIIRAVDVVFNGTDNSGLTLLEAKTILRQYADAQGINDTVSGNSFREINNITDDSSLGDFIVGVIDKLRCDYFTDVCEMDMNNSLNCTCGNGYVPTSTPNECKDDNECERNDTCHVNADCTNTIGSFECKCSAGHEGNGTLCQDIDECTNGTHTCDENAICNNTEGNFTCMCKEHYSGTGQNGDCFDIDECTNGTHTCDENAICSNTEGSFTCMCKEHFSGTGQKGNCFELPRVLFSEDMEPENCSAHGHTLSCEFRKKEPDLAMAAFNHYSAAFLPPAGFVPASTRAGTNFTAPSASSSKTFCVPTTTYYTPASASVDPALSQTEEVFSYNGHRQWFSETSCQADSSVPSGFRFRCRGMHSSQKGVTITKDATGSYKVTQKNLFLSSSCQGEFDP